MENDETLNKDQASETDVIPSDSGEGTGNMDICPNCLEPNTEDLAVCKYCGMPLHQGADVEAYEMTESEEELARNRAEAVPEEKKPAKKQESGFRRVMPWLGLYLIYYAITGCIDINRQIKQAAEEGQTVNAPLAYGAQVIWFAAGVMMAWPLIKKGYRKLRHLPDPEETEEPAEAETAENAELSEEPSADEGTGEELSAEGSAEEDQDLLPDVSAAEEIQEAENERIQLTGDFAENPDSGSAPLSSLQATVTERSWMVNEPVDLDSLLREESNEKADNGQPE